MQQIELIVTLQVIVTPKNNYLELDTKSNSALAELFADKKIGDVVTIEVDMRIAEMADGRIGGPIKRVGVDGSEADESAEPSAEQPMMMAMNQQPDAEPAPNEG